MEQGGEDEDQTVPEAFAFRVLQGEESGGGAKRHGRSQGTLGISRKIADGIPRKERIEYRRSSQR